jgi:hypothetical protein
MIIYAHPFKNNYDIKLPLRPSSRAENSFLETQHLVTRPDWTFDWTAALILEIGCGDAILNDSSNKTGPPH